MASADAARPTPRVKVRMSIRVTPSASCSTVTSEAVSTARVSEHVVVGTPSRTSARSTVVPARSPEPLHDLADRARRRSVQSSTATITSPGTTPASSAGELGWTLATTTPGRGRTRTQSPTPE